jgi:hypothetical protein
MSDDDATADRLRAVLRAGAAGVRPADDSLQRIYARAAAERRSQRRWLAPLAAVAAVALVAVGAGIVLAGRSGGNPSPGPGSGAPSATASGPSGPSASTSSSPSGTVPANGPVVALPVYYGASFEGQVRLYREYRASRATDHVAGALILMLSPASDPAYASLWPAGTAVTNLYRSGDVQYVKLSKAPDLSSTVAIQEVVYTVTSADPTVTKVAVAYPGGSVAPTARAPQWRVLAPVWILTPASGSTVHSPVVVSGTASVFEATVAWEVDRTDGSKVTGGSTMASIGAPGRGTWSVTVPLPAGSYVVKAWETSMKDGRATWTDSKSVTVR